MHNHNYENDRVTNCEYLHINWENVQVKTKISLIHNYYG